MRRCLETGAAIGRPFSRSPSPSESLNDIDYGQWQGQTRDEVRRPWPDELDTWYRAPDWAAIPGGESLQDLLSRTGSALRDVARRHPSGTVVLVVHDSVNRAILLHALGLPPSGYWRLKQDPCAINEIDLVEGSLVVVTVNETYHLREMA
jgi:phosphoserine phosphatase